MTPEQAERIGGFLDAYTQFATFDAEASGLTLTAYDFVPDPRGPGYSKIQVILDQVKYDRFEELQHQLLALGQEIFTRFDLHPQNLRMIGSGLMHIANGHPLTPVQRIHRDALATAIIDEILAEEKPCDDSSSSS